MFKVLITCLLFTVSGALSQVAVIAHKSVPVDEIKKAQLLDFYTGDIRLWSDGEPVTVFDLKAKGEVRDTFYKFLGKRSSRMKSIWMKRMLSGEGDPPEALETEKMSGAVAATPGAIGFVSRDRAGDDVKVLLIIQPSEGRD